MTGHNRRRPKIVPPERQALAQGHSSPTFRPSHELWRKPIFFLAPAISQARYHFEIALRLRPDDAATRYNLCLGAWADTPFRRSTARVGVLAGRSRTRRRPRAFGTP